MSSRSASRLESGLIARKGEAAPAAPRRPAAEPARGPAAAGEDSGVLRGAPRPAPRGLHGTIAVTVRLDPARYERLKVHGARARRTNQEILVQALDGYLRDNAE